MIYTVETYTKGEPDWVERHRGEDANAAFVLAQEFTESGGYNGIRVVTLFPGGQVWRSVRIDYDYMAGREGRG